MVFSLSVLWWRRVRGIWKLPDGRDWLRGKLGLVLMGRAMLSKSLIQFSIDGWSCVPSLLFTWGQTTVEVMKIMGTSFTRSHAFPATLNAPNPAAGHHRPTPPWRLLDTHGHVWVSLLWGRCSILLGPGAHKVLFVPSKSLFPQSCVSSGSSMVGLMATSSKRAYAIPRSAAPRAPVPVAVHCWPIPPQRDTQTQFCLRPCSFFESWCAKGMFEPFEWGMVFDVDVWCLMLMFGEWGWTVLKFFVSILELFCRPNITSKWKLGFYFILL